MGGTINIFIPNIIIQFRHVDTATTTCGQVSQFARSVDSSQHCARASQETSKRKPENVSSCIQFQTPIAILTHAHTNVSRPRQQRGRTI